MPTIDRTKIIVLHNDPVARAGLAATFGTCPYFEVLHLEAGFDGALRGLGAHVRIEEHVVVADYPNGVALASRISRSLDQPADLRVVIVAGNDGEREIRCALELGVKGYLLVGCELDELLAGVYAVSRGLRHLCPRAASRLAESVSVEALSLREEQVLKLVVCGLCNKAISNRLGIAVGTVKSHLKSIFGKLGVGSRTQAIAAAQRRGLLRTVHSVESNHDQQDSRLSVAYPSAIASKHSASDAKMIRAASVSQQISDRT